MLHRDMMEEFQESDVLWPDHDYDYGGGDGDDDADDWPNGAVGSVDVHTDEPCRRVPGVAGRMAATTPAKPIRVPAAPSYLSRSCVSYFLGGGGGGGRHGRGMSTTPPHVVTSRRTTAAEKVAFSMCSGGRGRTLKGRDLRRVRDAVLMMTGFIETS